MDEITEADIQEQAQVVKQAVDATMYYPLAHGEAVRLQEMIEEYTSQKT